jgi:putative transposase
MARRPRLFAAGVLYHVIVRGNQRQKTFTVESDYQAYIERLARYRKKYDYVLHAYCLMPNHVNLPVESSAHPSGQTHARAATIQSAWDDRARDWDVMI